MSTSSKKDSGQASSPSKTYIRHRVQSYVNTVEGVDPSREEYETEIPAEDEANFADKETVEVVEEVVEVSSITRGLIAETILGTINICDIPWGINHKRIFMFLRGWSINYRRGEGVS